MLGKIREKMQNKLADKAADEIVKRGEQRLSDFRNSKATTSKANDSASRQQTAYVADAIGAITLTKEAFQNAQAAASSSIRELKDKADEPVKKIEQLQTAASVTQYAGIAFISVSFAAYTSECLSTSGSFLIASAGIGLVCLGSEGDTILENMKIITENPFSFKELPSGKWKIKEIGEQLKKDTYLSGWIIDNIIIPMKFSN